MSLTWNSFCNCISKKRHTCIKRHKKKQFVSCCPDMDAIYCGLIWHQGPCMAPRSQESAASAGGYALPISWSSNSAKSIQIWLQPDLCRLQGLRLWKKSRHIQVFEIVNNFDCKQLRRKSFSDLCLNRNFMVVRLSDFFPLIWRFHVVSGFCCHVASALAIFRGRGENSLGRSAGWEPRRARPSTVYSLYSIHSTYSYTPCCKCLLYIWNCQRKHLNHHRHHPIPLSAAEHQWTCVDRRRCRGKRKRFGSALERFVELTKLQVMFSFLLFLPIFQLVKLPKTTGSSTSGTSRINRCNQCTLLNYLWMWRYRHMKPPAGACFVRALLPSFSSEHWLKHFKHMWAQEPWTTLFLLDRVPTGLW